MSVGMAGRLGSAETVRWGTCRGGHKADFLSGSSGLEEQCFQEQGGDCMAF